MPLVKTERRPAAVFLSVIIFTKAKPPEYNSASALCFAGNAYCGGMWSSSHHYGVTFRELSGNALLMCDMLVEMSKTLSSDIVYAGSGYPNFTVAALGGSIKYREIGAPDLEGPLIIPEKDLEHLDISRIDMDPVIGNIRCCCRAVRRT